MVSIKRINQVGRTHKIYVDPDWLYDQYAVNEKTELQIAEMLNISQISVDRRLKENNINVLHCGKGRKRSLEFVQNAKNFAENAWKRDPNRKEQLRSRVCGKNNPLWKGGISYLPYCPKFDSVVKEEIREKFGRKCYLCPKTEKENGKKLSVHHVDYQKSQGCSGLKWSLLPLCGQCHTKTNHNRWYWFSMLRDYWIYNYIDFSMMRDLI